DQVVTVSHSFIATANAVRYCGAEPVFVDIDPQTYNLDAQLLRAAITPRTRAILVVHQMGLPCDWPTVLRVATANGLPVIEDAACAIGSEIRMDGSWAKVGQPHGTVACFSFHPRKIMTTGDGGMITTRDPELDRRFRLLRQHGMNVSDVVRHSATQVIFEEYVEVGFNYRMTDIQAAVGRVQLRRLPDFLRQRRRLASRYANALAEIPGLEPPAIPDYVRPSFQAYPVRVTDEYPLSRDELMQALLEQGISTRRGIMNAHQEAPYASPMRSLPHSEAARDGVILLPLYSQMTDEEQDYVIEALKR